LARVSGPPTVSFSRVKIAAAAWPKRFDKLSRVPEPRTAPRAGA
jgi:hypothetical protein